MPERVGRLRVTLTCRPRLLPAEMKGLVVPTADDVELLFVVFRIAIRCAAKLYEVGLSAKVSVVVEPLPFNPFVNEILSLEANRFLLSIRPVNGINVREELLRVGFCDIPGWITENGVEA